MREAYLSRCQDRTAPDGLDGALASIVAKAVRPGLDDATVARHLARAVPSAGDLPAVAASFHAEDFGLVVAALEGDGAAQRIIVQTHLSQVPAWVARLDPSAAFADDVAQELASLLFAPEPDRGSKLLGYSGRGPLGGFLRTVAVRTAQNMRRGKREVLGDDAPPDRPATARQTPEAALARADRARSFAEILRGALRALPAEDRELLRLHYLDGLSIEGVAAARGVSRATAARHLARARDAVLARARAEHAREAGPETRASDEDIDVPSELALSLSQLFRG